MNDIRVNGMKASEVKIGDACRVNSKACRRISCDIHAPVDAHGDYLPFVTDDCQLLWVRESDEVQHAFGLTKEGPPKAEDDDAKAGFVIDLIKTMTGLMNLSIITPWIEERMKDVAAETLKPGSDEVITDLHTLDYIWDLSGDRSISGNKKWHRRALDYYTGRMVKHHMLGEGKLIRFVPEDDTEDKMGYEHGKDILSSSLYNRGHRYGIAVEFPCECGQKIYSMYVVPGVHGGAFAYLICEEFDSYLDLRNHCMTCENCEPKVKQQLNDIKEGKYG